MKLTALKYPYLKITCKQDVKELLEETIENINNEIGYLYKADHNENSPQKEFSLFYQWFDMFTNFGAADYIYEKAEMQGWEVRIEIIYSSANKELIHCSKLMVV